TIIILTLKEKFDEYNYQALAIKIQVLISVKKKRLEKRKSIQKQFIISAAYPLNIQDERI
ncbi:TPA: hypothetical protein ACPJLD_001861, partial [Haemophilus influenzae]